MKRILSRIVVYITVTALIVAGVAAFGYFGSQKAFWLALREEPVPSLQNVQKPKYDPAKPTVAVLLGNEITEGLDFTIPYQLFSMTGAYNVYAVAADNRVKSLSGGLDVVPHYSVQELDDLLGKSADIIVIPFMTVNDPKKYEPLREWIITHKETTLLSICSGADNLAATGLLNGKLAASHWQTMWILPKKYPEVNWQRDKRYVTNADKIITSAGISSGIDAVLYVISQKLGEPAAAKVAQEMNYPSYHFLKNPTVEPFYMDYRFATYVLNNAFQWNKTKAGVLLYNGLEEMALASVFDIYSDTGTTRVLSVAGSDQPVVTRHGLNVLSRYTLAEMPAVDKMIVPGIKAKTLAAEEIASWNEKANRIALQFVHADSPNRFLFEVQLEDLAKQEDLLTAKHAVKRLEYRADDIYLEGKPFPYETYGTLLLTLVGAGLIAFLADRRFIAKRALRAAAGR
ncbi:DJ-1/PfpI family protein [Paenibacillus hamazuiensis]|uniref:DJ-1/PfpI family protein n=1 Tax=Paenibacillus hamazuiensis TaxID=2936508 RepID=UPI00200F131D|nr:DJ-1/PfpI family protein [Paenibacillus hamazuiensis]